MSTPNRASHPGPGAQRRPGGVLTHIALGNWLVLPAYLLAAALIVASCAGAPRALADPQPRAKAISNIRGAHACDYPELLQPEVSHDEPPARALSPTLIQVPGWIGSSGERLTSNSAILDFPTPPATAADNQTLAMVSITVKIVRPHGWETARSLIIAAFNGTNDPHPAPICADRDPAILKAMHDSGHEPLPEHVEPGQTATGWAAFKIPRNISALTLIMVRYLPREYFARQVLLLKK